MNKIPVIETVAESYRFIFGGLGKIIGLIWLPILILTIGSYFTLVPYFSGMPAALEAGDISQQSMLYLRVLAFDLVMIVLIAMIAVAITREVLTPHKGVSYIHFSLGLTEFRVIGGLLGLFVLLIVFVIALVMIGTIAVFVLKAGLPGMAGGKQALGFVGLITLIGGLVLVYFLVRLSFLLVPAAVAEGNFGIERSWKLTKGNFLRILGVGLLTLLPTMLVCLSVDIAVIGPEFFQPPGDLPMDAAAQAHLQAAQFRALAAHMPVLAGIGFLLAPLTYGLTFAPAAFAYRALKAKAAAEAPSLPRIA